MGCIKLPLRTYHMYGVVFLLKGLNLEKIIHHGIKAMLCISFSLLLIAQGIMLLPLPADTLPVNSIVNSSENEGTHTAAVQIEMEPGYAPNPNIKILVNGTEAASMSSQSIELTVMNNSVIEVDGRRVNYPFAVNVKPADGKTRCDGSGAKSDGNIVRLSRVFTITEQN